MITLRRSLVYVLLAGLVAGSAGCWATKKDVQQAVVTSNDAMVSPYLAPPDETQPAGWQDAINQIDQLIASNPDQATLVNHLRVRAAMLFTVHREVNLAELRWQEVDGAALTTERDKALYANWQSLVWWYDRADDHSPLDRETGEMDRVEQAVQQLDTSMVGVTDSGIRVLLETVRAQMMVRKANSEVTEPNVEVEMAAALARYVGIFSASDQAWVRDNPTGGVSSATVEITEIRHRVYLRKMIELYGQVAADNSLSPTWSPAWIGPWIGALTF